MSEPNEIVQTEEYTGPVTYNLPSMMLKLTFSGELGKKANKRRDRLVSNLLDDLEKAGAIYRPNPKSEFRKANEGTQAKIEKAIDGFIPEDAKKEKNEETKVVSWTTTLFETTTLELYPD